LSSTCGTLSAVAIKRLATLVSLSLGMTTTAGKTTTAGPATTPLQGPIDGTVLKFEMCSAFDVLI